VFTAGLAFEGAEFHGSAWFGDSVVTGRADLVRARFRRHARFCDAVFDGPVDFTGARFDGFADFEAVDFRAAATFAAAGFAAAPPAEISRFLQAAG
jgi:hypothetical protein